MICIKNTFKSTSNLNNIEISIGFTNPHVDMTYSMKDDTMVNLEDLDMIVVTFRHVSGNIYKDVLCETISINTLSYLCSSLKHMINSFEEYEAGILKNLDEQMNIKIETENLLKIEVVYNYNHSEVMRSCYNINPIETGIIFLSVEKKDVNSVFPCAFAGLNLQDSKQFASMMSSFIDAFKNTLNIE